MTCSLRRFLIVAAIAVMPAAIAPASADVMDASTLTCQKLLDIAGAKGEAADKASQSKFGILMVWMQGYKAPDGHGAAVDIKTIINNVEKVAASCEAQPNLGVMTVTEKLWDDDEDLPSTAVDLSTVTCEAMLKTDDETRGSMIIWLLGYKAALAEDPTFDVDAFDARVKAIGGYCGGHPEMGLVTAADKTAE